MKYAIIENGVVKNVVVAEADFAATQGWIKAGSAAIGYTYQNGQFSKPVPVVDPLEYQQKRASEYPPITEYIDGIVKGDQAQVQAYIDACLAVKLKYPKP